ncbi:hypothetical protein J2X65_002020 [Ancylobacter sp. 3268]|nr:hypothetical protein [Ancylobacter sp. 3268]
MTLLASACVAGCATTSRPSDPCDGWQRIEPAARDVETISPQLARQIVAHDEYGEKLGCWQPPNR